MTWTPASAPTWPRRAKRFWHGYYSGKAVDHLTGGVIPIVESVTLRETPSSRSTTTSSARCSVPRRTAIGDKRLSIVSTIGCSSRSGHRGALPRAQGVPRQLRSRARSPPLSSQVSGPLRAHRRPSRADAPAHGPENIAYGERAVALFTGAQGTPPSRRPRGVPPGQTQLDIEHATAPTNS